MCFKLLGKECYVKEGGICIINPGILTRGSFFGWNRRRDIALDFV
jgi:hypothetical protein